MLLDGIPLCNLTGVREQVLNDCPSFYGLFDIEECFPLYPAVRDGLIPRFAASALAYDDIESIVLEVEFSLAIAIVPLLTTDSISARLDITSMKSSISSVLPTTSSVP